VKLVGKMMSSFIGSKEPKLIVGSDWCGPKLTMVMILEAATSLSKTISPFSCSLMIVARERRRGDRPPTKKKQCNVMGGYIWSMWGDKEFVVS